MNGLHIENMKKEFYNFKLGPIDLDMDAGYVVAVIGKNGCGKSTFFNCLLGTEEYSGECEWTPGGNENYDKNGNEDYNKNGNEQGNNIENGQNCISKKFAYILERCPFPKDYTPRELEKCFGEFYEAFDRKKYYDVLKRYNIPLNRQLSKLSRGNIMVVQMAFAFSYKSEVLFLDEPSAHLDNYAREELYELIGEYQDEGHIIFWSSHLMEELDKRADYVLAVKNGQQVYFGTKEELAERYHVVKGSKRQLDYMQKALVGRRDEENCCCGLVDTANDYLKLAAVDEPAGLADIVEYLL